MRPLSIVCLVLAAASSLGALPVRPESDGERKFGEVVTYRALRTEEGPVDLLPLRRDEIHLPDFNLEYARFEKGGWRGRHMQPSRHVFAVRDKKTGEVIQELQISIGGYIPPGGWEFTVHEKTYVIEMYSTTRRFASDDALPEKSLIVWDRSTARVGNPFAYQVHFQPREAPNQSAQTTPVSAPR